LITEQLKHIMLSSDEEFLQYAKYFRITKDNKHDFDTIITEINKRARYLGYDFELGCCGTNKLTRINK
jgi:hypothetical protein